MNRNETDAKVAHERFLNLNGLSAAEFARADACQRERKSAMERGDREGMHAYDNSMYGHLLIANRAADLANRAFENWMRAIGAW